MDRSEILKNHEKTLKKEKLEYLESKSNIKDDDNNKKKKKQRKNDKKDDAVYSNITH